MTKTQKAKAIITASYILYMINSLLDKSEQNKGSTINLFQKLRSKTIDAQYLPYVEMSNTAWSMTIEYYKDKRMRIAIFDAVEFLAYNEEESLKLMFGNDILTLVDRFVLKQTYDGVESDILKESREVVDTLTKNMRKIVFDNKDVL